MERRVKAGGGRVSALSDSHLKAKGKAIASLDREAPSH